MWIYKRRFLREVLATLIHQGRRDLIHPLLVMALSLDTAKQLLGFDPGDTPTTDEIKRAWKKKALEHHPDRGGDPVMMQQLNVAHDVLLGKQRPDRSGNSGSRPYSQEPSYQSQPRREPVKERVTWEEAMRAAKVPTTGVEWKFKTSTGYGGYDTDMRNESKSGFVIYGRSETKHIFVSVFDHSLNDYHSSVDRDIVRMRVETYPLNNQLSQLAPKVIREMWQDFPGIKGYNAKVMVFPEGQTFDKKMRFQKGRTISFKQAIELMGESAPSTWKGAKVDVVIELKRGEKLGDPYPSVLVVNGREYQLSLNSLKAIWKVDLYRHIFGTYYYEGSKKKLTRIKKAKQVLTWMVGNLKGEPDALMEALKAAAEQAK